MAPLHSRRLACRGSAPTLDRGQRGVFVIGQGEAVLSLRGMESKEEGGRDKDRERERRRREEGAREE